MKNKMTLFYCIPMVSLLLLSAMFLRASCADGEACTMTVKQVKDQVFRVDSINNSGSSVYYSNASPSQGLNIQLETPDGSEVKRTAFGEKFFPSQAGVTPNGLPVVTPGGLSVVVEIKPGQSEKLFVDISKIFDVTLGGDYHILVKRVVRKEVGGITLIQGEAKFHLESQPAITTAEE